MYASFTMITSYGEWVCGKKELTYAKASRVEPEIRGILGGMCQSIGIKSHERNSSPCGTSVPNFFLSALGKGVWSALFISVSLAPRSVLGTAQLINNYLFK